MVNYLNFNWLNPIACCWFNPFQCVICIYLLDPLSSHESLVYIQNFMAWHDHVFLHWNISVSSSAGSGSFSRPHPAEEFLSLQPNDTVSVLERQTGEWQGWALAQHGPVQGLVQLEVLDAQAMGMDGPMGAPRMRQKKGKKRCLTWEVVWRIYSDTGICMYLYVFVIDMTKLWIYIWIYEDVCNMLLYVWF